MKWLLTFIFLLMTAEAYAACPSAVCWVTTGGSGSTCTSGSPCSFATALTKTAAGDTVNVEAGTYTGSDYFVTIAGSSGNPITIRSTNSGGTYQQYGAVLQGVAGNATIEITSPISYVIIDGFDVTNPDSQGIETETGGSGTASNITIIRNRVHDIPGGCPTSGGNGIHISTGNHNTVDSNIVYNITNSSGACQLTHGIYSEDQNDIIQNNIVIKTQGWGIHLWHAASNETVVNNTVINNDQGGILVGCGDAGCVSDTGTVVNNNLVTGNGGVGGFGCLNEQGTTGTNTYNNNLCYNNTGSFCQLQNSDVCTNTQTTNPLLINNTGNLTGDYHVQSISPAVDNGTNTSAPALDFSGVSRPDRTSTAPDIGAYERGCVNKQCYVTTAGSGSVCTVGNPGTITSCMGIAVPGDTINVASGTYNVNPGNTGASGIVNTASGTSSNPITIVSTTPLGAILNENNGCAAGACNDIIWEQDGNWLVINGFKITGHARIGLLMLGNNNIVENMWVTALSGKDDSCSTGTAGIDDGYNGSVTGSSTFNANLVTAIGDGTNASCAAFIYVQKSGDLVSNNIIGGGKGGVGIQTWHGGTNMTAINNTVFNTSTGISIGCGDAGCTSSNSNVIRNNIVRDESFGIDADGTFGTSGTTCTKYDHNLLYNNTTNYNNAATGLTGISNMQACSGAGTGDLFVQPTMTNYVNNGSGDYHALNSSSPQIDAGTTTSAPVLDFSGNTRPDVGGTNPDMGAYEFGGTPPAPPTNTQIQLINHCLFSSDGTQVANVSCTYNAQAGDLIVIGCGANQAPGASSISDSAGNVYTIVFSQLDVNHGFTTIGYAFNITGGSLTTTCTSTTNGVTGFSTGQIIESSEWSNILTTAPLDQSSFAVADNKGTCTVPSVTTSQANELLLTIGVDNQYGGTFNNYTTTAGYTILDQDLGTGKKGADSYQIASAAGTFSASIGYAGGAGANWGCGLLTFEANAVTTSNTNTATRFVSF